MWSASPSYLKNIVEKLFDDNTNYTTPDQATNQASSLEVNHKRQMNVIDIA